MPIDECINRHTYRQYLTWMAWLGEQYNEPSRSDYYLMQIAQEVRRVLSKKPGGIKLLDFKLPFGKPKAVELDVKTKAKNSIKRWVGYFGGKVIHKYKDQ